jgi:hypothetical protein
MQRMMSCADVVRFGIRGGATLVVVGAAAPMCPKRNSMIDNDFHPLCTPLDQCDTSTTQQNQKKKSRLEKLSNEVLHPL